MKEEVKNQIKQLLSECELSDKINLINEIREFIHEYSPFKNEPVDFVK